MAAVMMANVLAARPAVRPVLRVRFHIPFAPHWQVSAPGRLPFQIRARVGTVLPLLNYSFALYFQVCTAVLAATITQHCLTLHSQAVIVGQGPCCKRALGTAGTEAVAAAKPV